MTVRPSPVVVVTGGGPLPGSAVRRLPADAYVIAADSGLDVALAAGLIVHEVVGDLDSASAAGVAAAEAAGACIERHPADKDRTDLDLALDRALARAPATLVVVGGDGGRLDHLLGNVALLARPDLGPLDPLALIGPATVTVVHGGRSRPLSGTPDELVSLLPVHGAAHGVTTAGLRWALTGDRLDPGSTRGVSNQFLDCDARVTVTDGVVFAVQPGQVAPVPPPRPQGGVGAEGPGRRGRPA